MQNNVEKHDSLKVQYMAIKEDVQAQRKSTVDFEAELNKLREDFKDKNEKFQNKARELKHLESKKNRLEKDLNQLKEHIASRSES